MRDLSSDFDYLYSDDIGGIEVYRRESERPPAFMDMNPCGAIVVWTRPRPNRPPGDDID